MLMLCDVGDSVKWYNIGRWVVSRLTSSAQQVLLTEINNMRSEVRFNGSFVPTASAKPFTGSEFTNFSQAACK